MANIDLYTFYYKYQFYFIFKRFFEVDILKNLYWIYYNIASVLCFDFFGHEACRISVPWSGIEHTSHPGALEEVVLTTGLSGKSL